MARKDRSTIAPEMAAEVLFLSDRTCCVCRHPKPVQIHHIDENPANNDADNLAVLCFDCHRDTQIRGGFDRKLDSAQVVRYRDDWIATVLARRKGGIPSSFSAEGPVVPEPHVAPMLPWFTHVAAGDHNVLIEERNAPTVALIAPFRNDPTPNRPHVGPALGLIATVRFATLAGSSVTGHWMNSADPRIDLMPGSQRLLVVAVIGPKFASLVSDVRDTPVREVEFKHFWVSPSTVNETELVVSLSSAGKLLGEYNYQIKLAPFPGIQLLST